MVRFNRTLNADSLPFTLTSEWHNCTFISNSKVLCVHCKRPFFFQSLIELWIKATYFRVNNHANFMPMWNFSQEQLLINLKLGHGIYCISMLRGSVIRCHQESGWTFVLSTNAAWDNFHFKATVEGFLQSNETIKCLGTFDTDYLQSCSLCSIILLPFYPSSHHKCRCTQSLCTHQAYRSRWRTRRMFLRGLWSELYWTVLNTLIKSCSRH